MIFFKQRKPMRRGGKEPESRGEKGGSTTYEKRMVEITQWNIEHTDILEVLRGQIQEERLISWSKALNIDGFVKSPSAAFRFILRHCTVLLCTPHSSGFARLASGSFFFAVLFRLFTITSILV
jgi:hypothetical protein